MINTNLTKFKISSRPEDFSASKKKSSSINSFHSPNILNNSYIHERPLKDASISFKGLSLRGLGKTLKNSFKLTEEKIITEANLKNIYKQYADAVSSKKKDYLQQTINNLKNANINKNEKFIEVVKDGYRVKERTALNDTLRSLAYPFISMPRDLINTAISIACRTPEQAANVRSNSILSVIKLQERYDFVKYTNLKDSILGINNLFTKGKQNEFFKTAHKLMDPTKLPAAAALERFLNRWESGSLSLIFLGNDMYNLTRLMTDDKKEANKERQNRNKQELGRLALTSGITLFLLNSFRKKSNKYFGWALGLSLASVVIGETVGRIIAGKRIFPISKKDAAKETSSDKSSRNNVASKQPNIANTLFISFNQDNVKADSSTKEDKASEIEKTSLNKKENSMPLAAKIALSAVGWTALSIASFKFGNRINKVIADKRTDTRIYKIFNPIREHYKEFMDKLVKNSKIKNEKLINILDSQMANDPELTLKYTKELAGFLKQNKIKGFENVTGENLIQHLKSIDKNTAIPVGKNPLFKDIFNTTVVFPVKLVLNLPVNILNMFTKPLGESLKNDNLKNFFNIEYKKPDSSIAQNVIMWAKNNKLHKKTTPQEVNNIVNETMLKSFNQFNAQDFSATDMNNWNKLLASAITGIFLVFDNYNHVMLKTKGEDKQLARQKAQERAVQEVSRNFFSTYIVKIFTDSTKSFMNLNLLNAGLVTVANVFTYENFTRMAVGLPVKPSSKQEIIDLEKKNESKKGLAGSYFRFMSYVTGKKSLSSRINKPNEQTQAAPKKINIADRKNNIDFSSTINNYVNSK